MSATRCIIIISSQKSINVSRMTQLVISDLLHNKDLSLELIEIQKQYVADMDKVFKKLTKE